MTDSAVRAMSILREGSHYKILRINNRWLMALGGSAFCVFVKYLLNGVGALTWE